jgi:hypothetical protein
MARGALFFKMNNVKRADTVALFGSVATILNIMNVSFEFYVP